MNDMLKYELKKYILKPSVIICLAVLLLVNLVKVLEIYCQGSGRQILFSGKGRIEISKDVLYEKYGGEITQEKIESLKAELAVAEQKLEEYGIIEEPIENTYMGYPYGDVNLIKDIISSYEYALLYTNTSNELSDRAAEKAAFYEGRNEYDKRESELYEYCFKGRAADSYINSDAYTNIFDYKFSTVISMLLIVLAVSPIVSKEYVFGYHNLIISSGKRKKVMHAKLFTAALFTVVMSFVVFLSDVFYWNQLYGLSGFGEPIYTLQEYALCPLDLNLFGALAVTYLLRLAILMMFTFLTTAISSFFKNDILSMTASIAAGFILVIGSEHLPGVFNPVLIIGTDSIFSEFSAVNIMGFPVFAFLVTLAEVIILTVIFAFITAKRGLKCC